MKESLLLVIFLWILTPCFSQIQITGTVLNQSSKKPISFANIGILNSPIGSISNEDGSFSLSIPHSYLPESLTFSSVGFSRWVIPIAEIDTSENYTIYLKEKSTRIREVIVEAKKEKNKNIWLGNKHANSRLIYADSAVAGSALALLIENKDPTNYHELSFPVYIKRARLKIAHNSMENFKVRVRILAVDSSNNNLPGEDLLQESIVVTSDKTNGWMNFDLSKYDYNVIAPFFLMFEWIMEEKDRLELSDNYRQYLKLNPEKIKIDTTQVKGEQVLFYHWGTFSAGTLFGASSRQLVKENFSCYYRMNSFGKWQVAPAVLTAQLLVSTQRVTNLSASNVSAFQRPTDDLREKIINSLNETNQVYISEKVHLHLDKYLYTLGEQIWLKAYILESNSHQLLPLSKVLYVELINPQNELVRRFKLPAINGTANGDIFLSDSLQQGLYRIRAYTNHMRNYDHGYFYSKTIQILGANTVKVEDLNSISRPEILVDFFPEGGTFINGLDNTIGFKITDSFGNGIDGELNISTNLGEHIIHSKTTHLGMGKFTLTPVEGTQYYAHIITPRGDVQGVELPTRENEGLRLMVNSLPENKFGINIMTNSNHRKVLLVGLSRNNIRYMTDIHLENGKANFLIPKSHFPNGIVQFTVFDDKGIPLAERLVFNKSEKRAQIKISPHKNSYLSRQLIKLKINLAGYENEPVSGNFSIAVTDQNQDIKDPHESNIISNLLLTSELRGKVENPAYYFETNSFKTLQDLDLVMLIHGWRRFTWNEILTGDIAEPLFAFEEGISIQGKVQKYLRDQSIETGKMVMVTVSGDPQYAEAEIDSTGYFHMYPLEVYENSEMVLQARNSKGKSNLDIDLISEEYPEISKIANSSASTFAENTTSENITYRLEESIRRLEIDRAFRKIDSITYLDEIVITGIREKGYRKSYGRMTILDLNEMPNADSYLNIFHLLQGRVSEVFVLGSVLDPRIIVGRAKNYKGEYVGGEPMYLIDGFPVGKMQILNTSIANVESIVLGQGVISITRKTGVRSNRRTGVINLTNVGYYVSRAFFSPDYSTEKEAHAKPDFRSTLFWNPEISVDSTGTAEVTFYNADYITNYKVEIEGVTAEGVPLHAITHIDSE